MPRDLTQQDIKNARDAAQATGDPETIAKTEQAIEVVEKSS